MQAMSRWTQDPAKASDHKEVYDRAVLLHSMITNLCNVYNTQHYAVMAAVEPKRESSSLQKSRTAMASGRNGSKDGTASINRQTQHWVTQMREGKV